MMVCTWRRYGSSCIKAHAVRSRERVHTPWGSALRAMRGHTYYRMIPLAIPSQRALLIESDNP